MSAWPQPPANGVFMQDTASQNLMNPSMANLYNTHANQHNNPAAAFDVNQFQNNALHPGMQNGSVNPQAAFGNSTYQVNPIVPSKRPRPGDEGMVASPRPNPNTLSASRSQTPLQNASYPAFSAPQQSAQPFAAPTPYQHLQHAGSANATPSPTMQNQQFRPPHPPQRMSTASPATFSQTPQGLPGVMSPAMPNQAAPGMMQPGQSQPFTPNQSFAQNFGGTPASMSMGMSGAATPSAMNMASNPQMQQQQYHQRLYQQRLQ